MNPKLLDKPERIRFLNDLKDRLIDKSNYLKNEADLTILHLLYGLNKLGLNGDTELIGLLRSQFRLRKVTSKTEFQNFIKENNKYLV